MKTLMKSVLVVATISLFAIPASASSLATASQDTVVKKDTVVTDTVKKETPSMYLAQAEVTFTKIETSALPEAVTKGVTTKYADYTIEEASKGSDNTYKIVLKKDDVKSTVIFNEAGEFVKDVKDTATSGIMTA